MFARVGVVDEGGVVPSADPRVGDGRPGAGVVGESAGAVWDDVVRAGDPGLQDQGSWEWLDDPHAEDWWVADALAELDGFAATMAEPAGENLVDVPSVGAGPVDAMRTGKEPADPPLPGEVPADHAAADAAVGGLAPAIGWAVLWESPECLEQLVPGAGLAQVLELLDPTRLADAALVEAVAAAERLAAWAHLQAALAAGQLSRRAAMNPRWRAPVPARTCVAGDELAMRLGWSRPAASRLVRDGQALDNELLLVADAVREGVVDTAKLRVLTDRLADRPGQLAWAVQELVLPQAATRTPSQLAADIDRALLTVDPQDAALRLPRAIATRHVCHPRRLPDGMAGLWAVLPAVDAARIDATLEATARAARAVGDPRTLDQLRADTLTDLATGDALLAGAIPRGDPGTPPLTDQPDEHRHSGPAAPSIRIPKVRIDVTVALSTLMGLDELPGELAGLGPVPADQARALAAGGTWRRVVTDPLTGAVLDVGRTRYRPPASLADHVIARDRQCAGPGCTVPAGRCDLDHTSEYHATPANGSPEQGTTSATNLGPLSTRCHRLKTDGGFTLSQTAPGIFEWLTPAGLAYRVIPGQHGRTERLDKPTHSSYPDEPPF